MNVFALNFYRNNYQIRAVYALSKQMTTLGSMNNNQHEIEVPGFNSFQANNSSGQNKNRATQASALAGRPQLTQ